MVDIHVSKMKWYYHTFYWWPPTYHCNHLSVLQAFPIFHWFGVQCHQVYQVLSDFPLSYLIVCQSCPNGSQRLQVFQGSYLVAFFLSSFLYPFLLLVNKLSVNYFCYLSFCYFGYYSMVIKVTLIAPWMAIVLFNISISRRGACRWRGWLLKFSNFSLHFRCIKECHFMAANLLPLNTKFTWFGFFSFLCFLFFSGWSGQSEIGIKTFFCFKQRFR